MLGKRAENMKKLRYYLIPILLFILIGCTSDLPAIKTSLSSTDNTGLKDKNYREKLVIYGNIDPKLKVTLEVNFKATNIQDGCFIRSSGWTSFIVVSVEDSSVGKYTYRLSVPIKWENSLGSNRCEYEFHGASLHVEYLDSISSSSLTNIILGQNNDDAFQINNQKHYDNDRDYKVRYLKDLSILYCAVNENKTSNDLRCESDTNISNIIKSNSLPAKLNYNVNIFIQNDL